MYMPCQNVELESAQKLHYWLNILLEDSAKSPCDSGQLCQYLYYNSFPVPSN